MSQFRSPYGRKSASDRRDTHKVFLKESRSSEHDSFLRINTLGDQKSSRPVDRAQDAQHLIPKDERGAIAQSTLSCVTAFLPGLYSAMRSL